MKNNNVRKFFNQFIKTVKKGVNNIGIITDKDGTILLNNDLKDSLDEFRQKNLGANIYIIANSGRTVQDMINCLDQAQIPIDYFDYIIGDNGGMCLNAHTKETLYKHVMDRETVLGIIEEFSKMGANSSQIRITDGENIFAYPSPEVKEYYKESKSVVYRDNIQDLDNIDITKLTLTGSHEQINNINKYIKQNISGYKTHMGKTFFPNKQQNNYRVDITRNAYKR